MFDIYLRNLKDQVLEPMLNMLALDFFFWEIVEVLKKLILVGVMSAALWVEKKSHGSDGARLPCTGS